MKILKTTALFSMIFFVTSLSAQQVQDVEKKMTKKLNKMDTDKNGYVDMKEVKAFYAGRNDKNGKPLDTEMIFYGLDKDDDNKITVEELAKGIDWKLGSKKLKAKNNQ